MCGTPARTVARGETGAAECREAQAVPRLSPARAQSGTRGPALRWDPAPEQRRDPCRRSIRADDRSEQPLLQRRRAGDGRQLSTLGLILPADGAAKRRADAFGELLLDQVRRRLRDTVHHLFRLRAREQVGQEIADDLRQMRGEGRGWIDDCVAGSRRAIALLCRNQGCGESPNAGSRVEVPSRLDAAVPGLIARR